MRVGRALFAVSGFGASGPGRRRPWDVASWLLVAGGLLVWWLCARFPAELPPFAPWEFSLVEFLGTLLPALWYVRGLLRAPAAERPGRARQVAFLGGVGIIYAVLQTHFVYLAQHMFFLNRLQHLAMHHLGPFLVALSWPAETMLLGMPGGLRRHLEAAPVRIFLRVVQTPLVGGVLFVGLIALWLQPTIHFHAMISPLLYDVMNWSMVLDGLLFWFFALDPRPSLPAPSSFVARLATVLLVMFPQILMGARITFGTHPLYSYYDLCGRLFPQISALHDQHLGGLIVWIPSSMMSSVALMLIMNNIRLHEDRSGGGGQRDILAPGGTVISSSSWTGR